MTDTERLDPLAELTDEQYQALKPHEKAARTVEARKLEEEAEKAATENAEAAAAQNSDLEDDDEELEEEEEEDAFTSTPAPGSKVAWITADHNGNPIREA